MSATVCGCGQMFGSHLNGCGKAAPPSASDNPPEPWAGDDPPAWAMERALEWWHEAFKPHHPGAGCIVNIQGRPFDLCRNDVSVIDRAECIAKAHREGWEAALKLAKEACDEPTEKRSPLDARIVVLGRLSAIPYQEPK